MSLSKSAFIRILMVSSIILPVVILSNVASGSLFATETPDQSSFSIPPSSSVYEAQKVVYHLTTGGGWFNRDHRHRLQNMENHMAALGADKLILHVVLQGDGVDLLSAAKSDPALQTRITALRSKGVKFQICRNTLVQRKMGMDTLYEAKAEDLVGAGVAEVARLQQQGYAYLRL